MALGLHLGIEPSTTARALNGVAMAAIVLLTFVLLHRHLRSTWTVLMGTALVALSPTLLRTADMIWSEPLFCALLLGFVVLAENLVRDPERRIAFLVACASIVWAAFLVRWVGIALIPAGMVAIFVAPSRDGPEDGPQDGRIRRVVGFAALASVVPALWLIRNVTTGDSLAGIRPRRNDSLSELARTMLVGIGRVVAPDGAPNALTELAAAVLIAAFVGGAVLAFRNPRPERDPGASAWPMTPLVAVAGLSLALLFGSYLFGASPMNARILAPVYAPLVVIVWAAGLVWDHGRAARGYAAPVWAHSALVHAAGRVERGALLYTNVPLPVVTITDRYPVLDARRLRADRRRAHRATARR